MSDEALRAAERAHAAAPTPATQRALLLQRVRAGDPLGWVEYRDLCALAPDVAADYLVRLLQARPGGDVWLDLLARAGHAPARAALGASAPPSWRCDRGDPLVLPLPARLRFATQVGCALEPTFPALGERLVATDVQGVLAAHWRLYDEVLQGAALRGDAPPVALALDRCFDLIVLCLGELLLPDADEFVLPNLAAGAAFAASLRAGVEEEALRDAAAEALLFGEPIAVDPSATTDAVGLEALADAVRTAQGRYR